MKPAAAVVFVLVAFAATIAAEAFLLRRQELRIRDLETAVARQSTPEGAAEIVRRAGLEPGAAEGSPGGSGATASPAMRSAIEKEVAARAAALEERLASLERTAASGGGSGSGTSEEELDAAVAKKVDEKLAGKKKEGIFGDDKKRPIADISKELGLTELQEDQMVQAIDTSQRGMFGVITTPRNDGTNLVDDIVKALQDPEDPQGKAQAVFMKLFTDKIPGTEETYLARIMTEKKTLSEEFRKILTPDQMKKYERLGQDPHEIQTGYDPFGEYVAERLGKETPD